jgi:uncharacterized protein (TIRG00374 family)
MAEAKSKKSKYVFLFLRIAVVVCGITWAILWFSREQRWNTLGEIFIRMNLWVFAATLAIFTLAHIIVSLRWWLLLRSQSIFIGFWPAVRLYFLGWFYNNFMPSSVGGDLVRAWYVTKHTDKKFEAVLSVFVDRAIGLLSTLIIAVFFYSLFLRGKGAVTTPSDQSGLLKSLAHHREILLWVIVAVGVVFCGLSLHKQGREMLKKLWSYVRIHAARAFTKLIKAIVIYCSKPLTILAAFALTVFVQIMAITTCWFLGTSMGIDVSVKYYYVFFTLTWVLGALPVSIGGAVVIEGMLAYMFIKFAGVQPEAALALALCQRIVWMITSLPGAVIHLIGAHLPKDFFVDYENTID